MGCLVSQRGWIEAHVSPSPLGCGRQAAAAPGLLAAPRKEVAGPESRDGLCRRRFLKCPSSRLTLSLIQFQSHRGPRLAE